MTEMTSKWMISLGTRLAASLAVMVWVAAIGGCDPSGKAVGPTTTQGDHDDHDHGDHDHGDHDHGHDHGEHDHDEHAGHDEHDHEDHEHGHDHGDHAHDGHDHGDHDHGDKVDASAVGLDADSLVHLDEPEPPKSLAEAIEKLTQLRDTVAKGFADKKVDDVHGELHDVGNLLDATEGLVESSKLDADAKKSAKAAIETLFDSYGDVDAKLHGEKGKEYSDVSDDIDSAIKTLSELIKP